MISVCRGNSLAVGRTFWLQGRWEWILDWICGSLCLDRACCCMLFFALIFLLSLLWDLHAGYTLGAMQYFGVTAKGVQGFFPFADADGRTTLTSIKAGASE